MREKKVLKEVKVEKENFVSLLYSLVGFQHAIFFDKAGTGGD
jgi:hypothetical protein